MANLEKAVALLDWFSSHLEVKPFELGGKVIKDKYGDEKLALTFVMNESPRQTYGLCISGNS